MDYAGYVEKKKSYVDTRIKKLKENYECNTVDDFDLQLLYETEYDIITCPQEHVKTKYDLVKTYYEIKSKLNLKKKYKEKPENILLVFNDGNLMDDMFTFIHKIAKDLVKVSRTSQYYIITTETKYIEFVLSTSGQNYHLDGKKFDHILALEKGKNLEHEPESIDGQVVNNGDDLSVVSIN